MLHNEVLAYVYINCKYLPKRLYPISCFLSVDVPALLASRDSSEMNSSCNSHYNTVVGDSANRPTVALVMSSTES